MRNSFKYLPKRATLTIFLAVLFHNKDCEGGFTGSKERDQNNIRGVISIDQGGREIVPIKIKGVYPPITIGF